MITVLGIAEILGGTVAVLVIGFVVWKVINAAIGGGRSPFTVNRVDSGPLVEPKVIRRWQEQLVNMHGGLESGCREVIEVQANDYKEAGQFWQGLTIAGNVTKVATRVGRNRWHLSYEVWSTGNGRGLTLQEYQEMEHPKLTGKKKWRGW
jgi:hypothetical protein